MKISIIITNYNYGKYVSRAIRSCLIQSMNSLEYEIIVIDDCSTDDSFEIISSFGKQISYYRLDENKGLSNARNIGIKKSKGDYIVFLDADDYISRNLLLVASEYIKYGAPRAVAFDYILVDENEEHIKKVSSFESPIACGVFYNKDCLLKLNGYDPSFRAREEEDLKHRFIKKYGKYTHCEIPLYRYRMHDNNLTKDSVKMKIHKKKFNRKHGIDND